jgi:hypothetical protein
MINKRELLFWIGEFSLIVPTAVIAFLLFYVLPIMLLAVLLGLLL